MKKIALSVTYFFQRMFTTGMAAGWTSIIACVLLLNGVILTLLGVLGEYIGRIYDETKVRTRKPHAA